MWPAAMLVTSPCTKCLTFWRPACPDVQDVRGRWYRYRGRKRKLRRRTSLHVGEFQQHAGKTGHSRTTSFLQGLPDTPPDVAACTTHWTREKPRIHKAPKNSVPLWRIATDHLYSLEIVRIAAWLHIAACHGRARHVNREGLTEDVGPSPVSSCLVSRKGEKSAQPIPAASRSASSCQRVHNAITRLDNVRLSLLWPPADPTASRLLPY